MTTRRAALGLAALSVVSGAVGLWLSDWFALAGAVCALAGGAWLLTEGGPERR